MPFGQIAAQDVEADRTVPLILNQLRLPKGAPILHVSHAGEGNPGWWNEVLADANAPENTLGSRAITAARTEEFRQKLRGRFARHIVRRLENVWHDDGKPAGAQDIHEFIMSLPRDVFDSIVSFCKDPDNFRTVSEMPASSATEIAGK